MYAVSPLRYPGAKGKIQDFVESLLRHNSLLDAHYLETYAGGASLALALLYRQAVSTIHLNDLDRSIFAFWKSAVEQTDEFCKRVAKTPVTTKEWFRQKEVQRNRETADLFDVGFSTFFLNRTNRSGILNAGIIGGKDQTGNWKIDARYNKEDLIYRIKRLGMHRSRIQITNEDAVSLIRSVGKSLPKKSFTYLDPPYFVKGEGLYLNAYGPTQHAEVRDIVFEELKSPWLVSYDDAPEIRALYKKARIHEYYLNYSASSPKEGKEVLFFSSDIKLPHQG